MTHAWDVIIVGGGPAGSGLATHLVRAGRAVLLLDRANFPRPKPCGECFSPPVRGMLSDLGVYEAVLEAGSSAFTGARLHFPRNIVLEGRYEHAPSPWAQAGGMTIPRLILDSLLWQNAGKHGACLQDETSVRGVLRDASGRITGVRTDKGDFRAPLVVGADGGHSRIAREMGVVRPIPRLQKIGIVSHYRTQDAVPASPIRMYVSKEHAVCGLVRGPHQTANLTCDVPESEARQLAAMGAEAYTNRLLQTQFPQVAERIQSWQRLDIRTCGTYGHSTTTPIADGALLVGDAATYIDPFTGEGVYFALRGAELAADAILAALRKGDTSVRGLASYKQARRAEFVPKYRLCQFIERAIHSDLLARTAGPLLMRQPGLIDLFLEATGDMIAPHQLLSPTRLRQAIRPQVSKQRADGVHLLK